MSDEIIVVRTTHIVGVVEREIEPTCAVEPVVRENCTSSYSSDSEDEFLTDEFLTGLVFVGLFFYGAYRLYWFLVSWLGLDF